MRVFKFSSMKRLLTLAVINYIKICGPNSRFCNQRSSSSAARQTSIKQTRRSRSHPYQKCITDRRLDCDPSIPFHPGVTFTLPRRRYRGDGGCFLERSIRPAELSPLTSYFQSPTPSSYRQPTRSLRCPRDLFDPEGNFVREQNRGRERNEGETFVTAFSGAPLLRERGEHARVYVSARGICGRSTLYSAYNVDFTCKSERITKATQRLYLI